MMRMIQKWRRSAPFFLSSVLYLGLTLPLQAQDLPTPTEPSPPVQAFSTFNADYQVYRNGKSHGTAKRYLHDKTDHYELGYSSDISWLVFSDKRSEISEFVLEQGQLKPLHYLMKRSGTGANRHYELRLDWQNKQLFTGKKQTLKTIKWQDNWLDPLSYHQQLLLDLKAGKTDFTYEVLNRDGNSRTYHYKVVAEEPLALPYGNIRAIRIARIEENSDKQVLAWLAPELDYMLVRLWRGEDNVEQFDVQLHKLEWLSRPSQSDGLAVTE